MGSIWELYQSYHSVQQSQSLSHTITSTTYLWQLSVTLVCLSVHLSVHQPYVDLFPDLPWTDELTDELTDRLLPQRLFRLWLIPHCQRNLVPTSIAELMIAKPSLPQRSSLDSLSTRGKLSTCKRVRPANCKTRSTWYCTFSQPHCLTHQSTTCSFT